MKNKKEIKKYTGISFKDIIGLLLFLTVAISKIILMIMFIYSVIVIFAYSVSYNSDKYNASNYENIGLHIFYFNDIEFYVDTFFSPRSSLGIRYKINYETTIDEQVYVYSLDDYRTKNQAIKTSEENPTQTAYLYLFTTNNKSTIRFSNIETVEKFVHDLSSHDRKQIKSAAIWLIICVITFICHLIFKRKKRVF